jgi:hypothetical protein
MPLPSDVTSAVPHAKAAKLRVGPESCFLVVSVPVLYFSPRLYRCNGIKHSVRISLAPDYNLTMNDLLVFAACDVTPEVCVLYLVMATISNTREALGRLFENSGPYGRCHWEAAYSPREPNTSLCAGVLPLAERLQ